MKAGAIGFALGLLAGVALVIWQLRAELTELEPNLEPDPAWWPRVPSPIDRTASTTWPVPGLDIKIGNN